MFNYCDLDTVENPQNKIIVKDIERLAKKSCLVGNWYSKSLRACEYPFVVNFIRENLKLGGRILDVGVSRSPYSHYLARMGYKVVAIDNNWKYIPFWYLSKILLRSNVKYKIADMEQTNFPASSFDCIISISVIEHMKDPRLSVIEAARLLRPGGYFIVTCDMIIPGTEMSCVHSAFTKDSVIKLFSGVEDLKPFGPLNFDATTAMKFYDWVRTTYPHHTYIGGCGVWMKTDASSFISHE